MRALKWFFWPAVLATVSTGAELPKLAVKLPELRPITLPQVTANLQELFPAPPNRFRAIRAGGVIDAGGGPFILPPEYLGIIDLFGGRENYEAALAATRVEVMLLHPANMRSDQVERYREGTSVVLSPSEMGTAIGALTDDASFDWESKSADDYFANPEPLRYELRLKFISPRGVVLFDLCPSERSIRISTAQWESSAQPCPFGYDQVSTVILHRLPEFAAILLQ